MVNTICAVAAMVFAFVMTYSIAFVIDHTLGMRVEGEEYVGLDICSMVSAPEIFFYKKYFFLHNLN